jgi:cytochrome P450
MHIGDVMVRRGQVVSMMLGAANRDPAVFACPDVLDVTRMADRHVGFGQGIHYCVGAPLARLEVGIALGSLIRELPKLALVGNTFEYHSTLGLRALKSLPVTIG